MKRKIYIRQNLIDYSLKKGALYSAKKQNLKDVYLKDLAQTIKENKRVIK